MNDVDVEKWVGPQLGAAIRATLAWLITGWADAAHLRRRSAGLTSGASGGSGGYDDLPGRCRPHRGLGQVWTGDFNERGLHPEGTPADLSEQKD